MTKRIFILCVAALICFCAAGAAAAESAGKTCVFDGYSLTYPEQWEYKENIQGIFLIYGEGFFQIDTGVFPEGFTITAQEMLDSGMISNVMENVGGEEFKYTSTGEVVTIGERDYVMLSAARDVIPFRQYIAFADNILLVFTVKGEDCIARAPEIIATLKPAEAGAPSSDVASGEHNVNKHIYRTDAEGKKQLVGIVSDPQPAYFSRFSRLLTGSLQALYEDEAPSPYSFGRSFYSDGRYVYVFPYYDAILRVYVTDDTENGQIEKVVITVAVDSVSEQVATREILDLVLASYGSLSDIGSFAYDHLFSLDSRESLDFSGPEQPDWTENGWSIVFEKDAFCYRCVIAYSGELPPVSGPAIMTEPGDFPPIARPGLSVEAFTKRFNELCAILKLEPLRFEANGEAGRVRNGVFGGSGRMIVTCADDADPGRVTHVTVETIDADTSTLWLGCCAALYAATDMSLRDFPYMLALHGAAGTWAQICGLKPAVYVDGVVLQAFIAGDRPVGALYGESEQTPSEGQAQEGM